MPNLSTLENKSHNTKPTQSVTFTASPYQKAVFTALLEDTCDLQIEAVAGSGKTTTLIEALKLLPSTVRNTTLVSAFNKDIARALESKVPLGVTVKTNHAIGHAALGAHFMKVQGYRWNPCIAPDKYRKLTQNYWVSNHRKTSDKPMEDESEMFPLLNFVRLTLTNPNDREAVLKMAAERDLLLPNPDRMLTALPRILEAGMDVQCKKKHRGFNTPIQPDIIDFTDMLWLPVVLDITLRKYGLVMVDEAQDLNTVQRELLLRCRAPGGRMVFVGDPRQAIYAFCGADADSWSQITTVTNAKQLPLSVCYRCPEEVINLAKEVVPNIEAAPNARKGHVETITTETFERLVNNHDMVLCRITAPLISTAFKLISEGKPAKVRGRDICTQLIKLIDSLEETAGFEFDRFLTHTSEYREKHDRILRQKQDAEALLAALHDRVDSIEAVYLGAAAEGVENTQALRERIDTLFTDSGNGHIILSSIHRAKGLEADRVFLLRPDQLPHPMATTEAALVQEHNLRYVAITRAMQELYIVISEEHTKTAPPAATTDVKEAHDSTDMSPARILDGTEDKSGPLIAKSQRLQSEMRGLIERKLVQDRRRLAQLQEIIRQQEAILETYQSPSTLNGKGI